MATGLGIVFLFTLHLSFNVPQLQIYLVFRFAFETRCSSWVRSQVQDTKPHKLGNFGPNEYRDRFCADSGVFVSDLKNVSGVGKSWQESCNIYKATV